MASNVKKSPLAKWEIQNWTIRLYEFISLEETPSFLSNNDIQLYNQPAYLFIQSEASIYTLLLENKDNRQLKWMHFRKENSHLVNSQKSPWGGWEGNENSSATELSSVFPFILEAIGKQLKCDSISWTSPPDLYYHSPIPYFDKRFTSNYIDTIYLAITSKSFLTYCRPNEVRRYRKCLRAEMIVQSLVVTKGVYDFILNCYSERNYQLSISYQLLASLVARFPNHYAAVGVFHHNKLIAATIYVRVNSVVIYNFLPASLLTYQHMSPIVLLYDYLYSLCQLSDTKYLDLGVSQNRDGSYKKSLAQFKLNMGGRCTQKNQVHFTFTKPLLHRR